jgi:protein-L-isoaspartate(D-aspartate) O-methyltransferase
LAATRDGLLRALGRIVRDERVLEAMAAVPRDAFVPPELHARAWEDAALPIGLGQTISQPRVVARMCELLALCGDERVLDVGTGSGYHAAVLGRLAARVHSVERHAPLAHRAADALQTAGCANVTVHVGDGTRGLPDLAPFDAVNVAATGREELLAPLAAQLAPGGRLVAPVRNGGERIVCLAAEPDGVRRTEHEAVRFVPLVEGP